MSETRQERSRRKFAVGVFEQIAAAIGALAAGIVITAVIAPLVANVTGMAGDSATFLRIATAGGFSAMALFCAAAYLRGIAKQVDDDQIAGVSGEDD